MTQFRTQLVNSQNCDLDVLLASARSSKKWDSTMKPSSETGEMIKLMAYEIVDHLKKYSKQIVNVRVESDEPHVLLNAIALLSMIPRQGSRLFNLGFSTLISSVLAKTPMKMEPSPIWLRSGNSSFTNIPTDFSYLTNLKRLEINNSTWLNEGLQLPNDTKVPYIGWTGYLETVFSPKDFKGSPQVVANLTMLYILTDLRDQDSDIAEWITGSDGQLTFQRLQILILYMPDIHGFWFIRH